MPRGASSNNPSAASLLREVRWRLRLQRALRALPRSVAEAAAAVACMLLLAAIVVRLPFASAARLADPLASPWIALPLVAGILAIRLAIRWRRNEISPLDAAIEIDRRLGLAERVSSAAVAGASSGDPAFREWVRAEAARRTAGLRASSVAPWAMPRGGLVAFASLAAVALLLWLDPQGRIAAAPPPPPASPAAAALSSELAAIEEIVESAEATPLRAPDLEADPANLEASLASLDAEATRLAAAAETGDAAAEREAIEAAAGLGSMAERLDAIASSREEAIEAFAASFEGLDPRELPPLAAGLAERILQGDFESAIDSLESLADEGRHRDEEVAAAIEALSQALSQSRDATRELADPAAASLPADAADDLDATPSPGLEPPSNSADDRRGDPSSDGGLSEGERGLEHGDAATNGGESGNSRRDDAPMPDAATSDATATDPPSPDGESDPRPPSAPEDASEASPAETSWLDRFAEALRDLAPQPSPAPSPPSSRGEAAETPTSPPPAAESANAGEEPPAAPSGETAGESASPPPAAPSGETAETVPPPSPPPAASPARGESIPSPPTGDPATPAPSSSAASRAAEGDEGSAQGSAESAGGSADRSRPRGGELASADGQGAPSDRGAADGAGRGARDAARHASEVLRQLAETRRGVEQLRRDARSLDAISRRLADAANGRPPAPPIDESLARGEPPAAGEPAVAGETGAPQGERLATWLEAPDLPEGTAAEAIASNPAAAASLRRAAERAIEGGAVHPRHHAAVRRYFSRLEATKPPAKSP